jgi:AmmeMemoRadiSam system protein A/AmmeMemoRadiSam system protein B
MNRELTITKTLINNYLDIVTPIDGSPLGLLVSPNAGRHTFPLLAAGLRQMGGRLYDVSVLLATSTDQQAYIQKTGEMDTPVGSIEIESLAADALEAKLPEFQAVKLDRRKRSVLMEEAFYQLLPFLKQVAPETKVLPLLLPENDFGLATRVGSVLTEILDGLQSVVIAQAALERSLFGVFEFNDPEIFTQAAKLTHQFTDQRADVGETGAAAAAAGLQFAHQSGGNTVSVIEQHVRGSLNPAAVMLWDYQAPQLNSFQKEELVQLALKAVETYLREGVIPDGPIADPAYERKSGVFVTLRLKGILRGCIGHMSAEKPLAQAVQEMAVAAATSDPRFPPLTEKELKQISVKVAILSPMQRISTQEVEVGRHGLLISHNGRRGVLLPEVAAERGWNRETFLENLCVKAGLPRETWHQEPALYAFTSVVFGESLEDSVR